MVPAGESSEVWNWETEPSAQLDTKKVLSSFGKENAIRAAAGLDFADQHAGLRIDDDEAVVIEVGRIEEMTVLVKGHVSDEILLGAFGFFDDGELARGNERSFGIGELVDGGAGAAADIDEVAFGREGQTEPGVGDGTRRISFMSLGVDDADGWRLVASIEDQQIAAIGRERARHGKRVDSELFAGGLDFPAVIKEESAAGEGAGLFAVRGLRDEDCGGKRGQRQGRRGRPLRGRFFIRSISGRWGSGVRCRRPWW